jgi:hypothetical protein
MMAELVAGVVRLTAHHIRALYKKLPVVYATFLRAKEQDK